MVLAFKVVLTLYKAAALKLNQPHIFYCTVIISQIFALKQHKSNLGSITNPSYCTLVKILLFGDQNYTQVENSYVINATIKYLVKLLIFGM